MPCKLHWGDRRLRLELFGNVRPEEIMKVVDEAIGSRRFDDVAGLVVDLLGVERLRFEEADYRLVGAYAGAVAPEVLKRRIRAAYVVADDEELRAKLEYYLEHHAHQKWDRKIVATLEEGEAWVAEGRR